MRTLIAALLIAAVAAGCGFQLRGSASVQLPYKSLHLALPSEAEQAVWLKRYIESAGGTALTDRPEEAEATLQQLYDNRQRTILSVNAQGQVQEYRLQVTYGFRIVDPKGRTLVPPNEITVIRDMTYNASAVLAKEQEEMLLWRDINFDVAAQVMRRLAIVKPRNPNLEEEQP
jgi:LPS-assembly lipoprotein